MHDNASDAFTVRRFRADDAAGVCQCFRRIYGDSYPRRDVYDPARLGEVNRSGKLSSLVAQHESGQIAAHIALEPAMLGAVAEVGMALVLPEFRRYGLFRRLREFATLEGGKLGLAGLFSETETDNIAVQTVTRYSERQPCGITLNLWPDAVRLAGPTGTARAGRWSFVLQFGYLKPPAQVLVHLPTHLRDMVTRIYAQYGLAIDFRGGESLAAGGRSVVNLYPATQSVFFRVQQAGAEALGQLTRTHDDFRRDERFVSMYLELPLAQAQTVEMCLHAERLGFFFSGIGPHYCNDGDALRLQCLKNDPHCTLLRVLHPFAQELLAYVGREWERVRA